LRASSTGFGTRSLIKRGQSCEPKSWLFPAPVPPHCSPACRSFPSIRGKPGPDFSGCQTNAWKIDRHDYRNRQEVPLGQGTFDLAGLAKTVEATGWSGWAISEEDYPNGYKPGSAAIKVARESIRQAFHV
jgi:hypothetical protein